MSDADVYLKDMARDMRELVRHIRDVVRYMKEAESEVPEKMRRFIMYFHDMHDLRDLYHQAGVEPPGHILREIEKCSDRLKHLLDELYTDGGAFEKVRQEMTKKEGNRYDYTQLLGRPAGEANETGNRQEPSAAQAELPLEQSES